MKLPECTMATSKVIVFFDELFDSFNGSNKKGMNSLINDTSNHIMFWNKALHKLRSIEYVEKTSHKSIIGNKAKCITNWIKTI